MAVEGGVERALALHELNRVYRTLHKEDCWRSFPERALEALGIKHSINDEDLKRIPRSAGAIVVANHPFGAVEGIILADILGAIRSDVKIMANYLLEGIRELRESLIFVDPFGSSGSVARNIKPLKNAVQWLKNGGMLVVFPAGEVSSLNLKTKEVSDPVWSDTVAKLVRLTGAPVLPLYFKGANSMAFQLLGLVHPKLRTIVLPRELLNKKNRTINLFAGDLIDSKKLRAFSADAEITDYLRFRTYALKNRAEKPQNAARKSEYSAFEPVLEAKAVNTEKLAAEVESLGQGGRLVEGEEFEVYAASAPEIPELLIEIGRLREVTFRAVGEGTGKVLDIDEFDDHYLHLFVWNRLKKEVVGAYRVGRTDEILKTHGRKGLYSGTLFKYGEPFYEAMNPALELGRSFVRPEYQKGHSPLLLLWKGICAYIAKNPKYRRLFGPVSINNDYRRFSRELMVSYFTENCCIADLASSITPRNPFRVSDSARPVIEIAKKVLRSVEAVSDVISDIEPDSRPVPILIKQYLRLGGKFMGFNVDTAFSSVLDGLILVDLAQTELKALERYFGKDRAESFLDYHGKTASKGSHAAVRKDGA